jgi:hypothetical protein
MAIQITTNSFKYNARLPRGYNTESNFMLGMSDTLGALPDGQVKTIVNFDIINDGQNLQPRPGLRSSKLFIPNIAAESTESDYHDANAGYLLNAAIETVESDGKTHYQFIVARCNKEDNTGHLYVASGADALNSNARDAQSFKMSVRKDIPEDNISLGYTMLNTLDIDHPVQAGCLFNKPVEAKIHNVPIQISEHLGMGDNESIAELIGCWGFGSSYYFLTKDKTELTDKNICIYKTKYDETSGQYELTPITIKQPNASEAATYGLNMLLDNPETFVNKVDSTVTEIDCNGILLYDTRVAAEHIELYPRKNKSYKVRLNYTAIPSDDKWLVKLLWREQADVSWNEFHAQYIDMTGRADGSDLPIVEKALVFPSKDIMIRAEIYKQISPGSDDHVGVDYFTRSGHSFAIAVTASTLVGFFLDRVVEKSLENTEIINYDLKTATGLGYWRNRLYIYGVPRDPKILFLSDLNDPGYFPYPTNAINFDFPVIHAVEYMGKLLVFTTKQIVMITANPDGMTWNKAIVQDNLSIDPWDRHLIQPVKNMVFFKSGNYYYMVVPKAISMTGELTMAPVSIPITDFLDNFQERVFEYLDQIYPALKEQNLSESLRLATYYNYLDYEDIHNVYVYKYEERFIHIDLQYNYVSRTWKIYVYEGQDLIKPYKHNATQKGELMASTFFDNLEVQTFTELVTTNVDGSDEKVVDEMILRTSTIDVRGIERLRYSRPDLANPGARVYTYSDGIEYSATHNRIIYIFNPDRRIVIPVEKDDTYGIRYQDLVNKDMALTESWQLEKEVEGYWVNVTSGKTVWPLKDRTFRYNLSAPITSGTVLKILDRTYIINSIQGDEYRDTTRNGDDLLIKWVRGNQYQFIFDYDLPDNDAPVIKTFVLDESIGGTVTGRCIQFFKYNPFTKHDYYVPNNITIQCADNLTDMLLPEKIEQLGRIAKSLSSTIEASVQDVEDGITFQNWQFLDTGNREYNQEHKKRYRELQIFINNLGGSPLDFSMSFTVDDVEKMGMYEYVVEQITDPDDPKYGLLYITPNPVYQPELHVDSEVRLNTWGLDASLFPELSLWKLRMPVGGKGYSPRFKIISRNQTDYTIMSYTWVHRTMYLR